MPLQYTSLYTLDQLFYFWDESKTMNFEFRT